jgi:hypothetical protein
MKRKFSPVPKIEITVQLPVAEFQRTMIFIKLLQNKMLSRILGNGGYYLTGNWRQFF